MRLDPELEGRLQRAAAIRGESLSEFIRRAAAERADATLVVGNGSDLAD
ncbi:MAG: type II toxin -antitoxin system TacA 1-like antitoxin, partial [Candidatus Dormibacteria bacterium]